MNAVKAVTALPSQQVCGALTYDRPRRGPRSFNNYYCYYPYLHYRKLRATIEYRDCYTTRLGPANSLFYLHARTGSPYGAVVAGKVKQTLACSDLCRGMQTEHCAMTAEKTMKSK